MFVLHPRSSRKDSRQLEHQEFSSSNTGMTIPLGRTEAVCPQHSKNQINTHWLWAPGLHPPHGAELGKIPRLLLWNGLFSPPHPTNSWSHLGAQLICRLCWEARLSVTFSPRGACPAPMFISALTHLADSEHLKSGLHLNPSPGYCL